MKRDSEEADMRTCAYCHKELKQRIDEPSGNFHRRQYCDKGCADKGRIKIIPPKHCLNPKCRKQLIQRKDETRQNYSLRQTCGNPKCLKYAKGQNQHRRLGVSVVKVGRVAWKPENEIRLGLFYDIRLTALEAGAKAGEELTGLALDIVKDEPDRVLLGGVRRAA